MTAPVEFDFDVAEREEELARAFDNFEIGSRRLFENERIRVWDIELAPGERLPFHRHRWSYFYRCHNGGRTRVRLPGGRGLEFDSVTDEVHFHAIGAEDIVVHDLENVGGDALRFTTVELLDE